MLFSYWFYIEQPGKLAPIQQQQKANEAKEVQAAQAEEVKKKEVDIKPKPEVNKKQVVEEPSPSPERKSEGSPPSAAKKSATAEAEYEFS